MVVGGGGLKLRVLEEEDVVDERGGGLDVIGAMVKVGALVRER